MTDRAVALSQADYDLDRWYAIHVRSNSEKVVQSFLQGKGYAEFLPMYRQRVRWSDRMKDIDVPLFKGYVFGQFPILQRLPIVTIPGVVRIVGCGSIPVPVDNAELAAIRSLLDSGLPITPWPYAHIGDRVLIESGPLTGLEGIFVETKNQYRVIISVTLLQRSVGVECDRGWVRRLPDRKPSPSALTKLPQNSRSTFVQHRR